jgi:HSP20 family protein
MPETHGPDTDTERARQNTEGRVKDGGRDAARRPHESAAFAAPAQALSDAWRADRMTVLTPPELWRDAFRPLASIQSEMARWFDDLWREAANGRGALSAYERSPAATLAPMAVFAGLPRADLKETEGEYKLHVELPGLKAKDVNLEVDGDTLVVGGVKSDHRTGDDVNYHITERRFGRVERRFALPVDVDPDKIRADFSDGVLNITMPKDADTPRKRRIDVQGG